MTCALSAVCAASSFLSTPSARRATHWLLQNLRSGKFLSTPSARRATSDIDEYKKSLEISIHALREEGDEAGYGFMPE